jgi:hypothetical protein
MNKFENEIVVKEYVNGFGWIDSCTESNIKAARETKKAYQAEGVGCMIVRRRVLNRTNEMVNVVLNHCRDYFRANGKWPESFKYYFRNGKVKFTLSTKEMQEILGYDSRLVEA